MPLAADSRFGRFRIVRQLGAGAMGEVYLAEDPQIERLLAIKTVRASGGEEVDRSLRERLAREARAAGRLVHPHVVTLFDAGEIDGVFYLAFEYVEGSDLTSRMRRQPPVTTAEAVRIVREAASGLAAAHRRGIVHRDVKPSNLLLDETGTVKVADFGIAKVTTQTGTYTASGSIVGTPQYLSPEQVKSEPLDGRSDLFSLGVVLYELLAQRRPFDGDTFTALMYQILHQEPPSIAELRPRLPPRLAAAVARLLAKDREERFPNGESLVAELAEIERGLAAMAHAPTLRDPARIAPSALPDGHAEPAGVAIAREPLAPERVLEVVQDVARPKSLAVPGRRWLVAGLGAIVLIVLGALVVAAWVLPRIRGLDGAKVPSTSDGDAPPLERALEPPPPVVSGEARDSTRDRPSFVEEGEAKSEPLSQPGSQGSSAATDRRDVEAEKAVPVRVVGLAVTFAISPPAAASRAVVKVDGLVRGPAAASLVTLRPGEHRLEILAEGYEPLVVLVEARSDPSASTRLDLSMVEEGRAG